MVVVLCCVVLSCKIVSNNVWHIGYQCKYTYHVKLTDTDGSFVLHTHNGMRGKKMKTGLRYTQTLLLFRCVADPTVWWKYCFNHLKLMLIYIIQQIKGYQLSWCVRHEARGAFLLNSDDPLLHHLLSFKLRYSLNCVHSYLIFLLLPL